MPSMEFWEEVVLKGWSADENETPEFRLQIRELPMADGVYASTGCQLWSASIVLAEELLKRPHLLRGKRVVEVGAGCGLLGITAARLAKWTLLTDADEEVVTNLRYNLEHNKSFWHVENGDNFNEASTRTMMWEDAVEGWAQDERVEVVVGSDIIYGHWGETVAKAMMSILQPSGIIMLAASEDRRSGVNGFKDYLKKEQWKVCETKLKVPLGQFRIYECSMKYPWEEDFVLEERFEREGSGYVFYHKKVDHNEPVVTYAKNATVLMSDKVATATWKAPKGETKQSFADESFADDKSRKTFAEKKKVFDVKASIKLYWKVAGGTDHGGIIVRSDCDLTASSSKLGRLQTGAVIEELQRLDRRLQYCKVNGDGPETGWVSVQTGRGKALLTPVKAG